MSWERVVVAVPSYSGVLQPRCQESISALGGGKVVKQEGMSDVSQARTGLLSHIVEHMRDDYDIVLCVDDDIAFSVKTALRVVTRALHEGRPVSAAYGMLTNQIAATRMPGEFTPAGEQLWNVGLGFVAIPMALLAGIADMLPLTLMGDRLVKPLCTSGPIAMHGLPHGATHRWDADDYSLCRRMGGVILEPVGVKHLKRITMELEPDAETIRRLTAGESLEPDPSPLRQGAVETDAPATEDELPAWRRRARRASAGAQQASALGGPRHVHTINRDDVGVLDPLGFGISTQKPAAGAMPLPEPILRQGSPAGTSRIPKRGWREQQAALENEASSVVARHVANQAFETAAVVPEVRWPEAQPFPLCEKCSQPIPGPEPGYKIGDFRLCLECATAPDAERSEHEQADPGLRGTPDTEGSPTTAR